MYSGNAVHFEIAYNGDRIIEINVSTDPSQVVDISEDVVKVKFSVASSCSCSALTSCVMQRRHLPVVAIKLATWPKLLMNSSASALQRDDLLVYRYGTMHDGGSVAEAPEESAASSTQVEGQQIPAEFTYSVTWRETTVPFEKRMDKYRRYQFLPQHLEVRGARQVLFWAVLQLLVFGTQVWVGLWSKAGFDCGLCWQCHAPHLTAGSSIVNAALLQ